MSTDIQSVQPVAIEVLTDPATANYAAYLKACGVINATQDYRPSDEDYMSLSKAARLLRLDPVAKEIYFIGGRDGRKVGVIVATFVHVRNAKRAAKMTGDDIDIQYYMPTDEQIKQYNISDGDTAVEARLYSLQAGVVWYRQAQTVADLVRAGVYTAAEAREIIGARPYVSAVGIVRASERFGDESKYSRMDRARKRATKAVLTTSGYKITNYEAALIAHGLTDRGEEAGFAGYDVRQPDLPQLGLPSFMAEGIQRVTPQIGEQRGHEHNRHALGRDESDSLIEDAPMPQSAAIPSAAPPDPTPPDMTVDAIVERAERLLTTPPAKFSGHDFDQLKADWREVFGLAKEAGLEVEPMPGDSKPRQYAEGIVRVGRQIIEAEPAGG